MLHELHLKLLFKISCVYIYEGNNIYMMKQDWYDYHMDVHYTNFFYFVCV